MKHTSKSRQVRYIHEAAFTESTMDQLLDKAMAAGIITQYDSGRGNCVWYEGRPGPALRTLRAQVLALLRSVTP